LNEEVGSMRRVVAMIVCTVLILAMTTTTFARVPQEVGVGGGGVPGMATSTTGYVPRAAGGGGAGAGSGSSLGQSVAAGAKVIRDTVGTAVAVKTVYEAAVKVYNRITKD
jgi:hypothetical protein